MVAPWTFSYISLTLTLTLNLTPKRYTVLTRGWRLVELVKASRRLGEPTEASPWICVCDSSNNDSSCSLCPMFYCFVPFIRFLSCDKPHVSLDTQRSMVDQKNHIHCFSASPVEPLSASPTTTHFGSFVFSTHATNPVNRIRLLRSVIRTLISLEDIDYTSTLRTGTLGDKAWNAQKPC